jgi:V/A-type H+-transporting ATPase subunit I
MIIKVKKILIYGLKQEMEEFFTKTQAEAIIEIIHKAQKITEMPSSIQDILSAIKIIKHLPVKNEPFKEHYFDPKMAAKEIMEIKNSLDALALQKKELEDEVTKVSFFGHFSNTDLQYVEKEGKRIFQFFSLPSSLKDRTQVPQELVYLGTEYDLDYYVSIDRKRKNYPKMYEIFLDRPLKAILQHIKIIQEQILTLENELKNYQDYLPSLQKELIHELNLFHKAKAENQAIHPLENDLFMIEAWLPLSKEKEFKELIRPLMVEYTEVIPDREEKIPTFLKNEGLPQIGEDLIKIYDVPSSHDKDPSSWVLFFFALFYGMIIDDAGYGLIYLLIGAFLHYKIKKTTPAFLRIKKLIFLLGISCSFVGILQGEFFGLEVSPKSSYYSYAVLNKLVLKKADYHLSRKDDTYAYWLKSYPQIQNAKDGKSLLLLGEKNEKYEVAKKFRDAVDMELALLVGIIHLCCSMLRDIKNRLSNLGWILFLIGGYLYFPFFLHATSITHFIFHATPFIGTIGFYMMCGGIGLAVTLAVLVHRWLGLEEITKVIQVFSDSLSYLRLYALALAGSIIASVINEMAGQFPLYGAIFLLLIGHGINFVIGIMGGVIHGLRLNFIEWYHYSFIGDGKILNPLKLLK